MNSARKDPRHRAREAALQVLYQWEVGKNDIDQAATLFFEQQWPNGDTAPADVRRFATELARETVSRLIQIDDLIAETAERWRPERMAVLDRLIMRMAVCEFVRGGGTPTAVVINEALELARTFSTDDAIKFINGMLDAIRKKLESRA